MTASTITKKLRLLTHYLGHPVSLTTKQKFQNYSGCWSCFCCATCSTSNGWYTLGRTDGSSGNKCNSFIVLVIAHKIHWKHCVMYFLVSVSFINDVDHTLNVIVIMNKLFCYILFTSFYFIFLNIASLKNKLFAGATIC